MCQSNSSHVAVFQLQMSCDIHIVREWQILRVNKRGECLIHMINNDVKDKNIVLCLLRCSFALVHAVFWGMG